MKQNRVRVLISGRVQGVGFRYWIRRKATRLGVEAEARNLENGQVEAVFRGEKEAVLKMIEICKQGPPLARVDQVEIVDHPLF